MSRERPKECGWVTARLIVNVLEWLSQSHHGKQILPDVDADGAKAPVGTTPGVPLYTGQLGRRELVLSRGAKGRHPQTSCRHPPLYGTSPWIGAKTCTTQMASLITKY